MTIVLASITTILAIAAASPIAIRRWRYRRAQREVDRRFDALVARMQTPQARDAWDTLRKATPEQLAAVSSAYMRRERSVYRIQNGLPPEWDDVN